MRNLVIVSFKLTKFLHHLHCLVLDMKNSNVPKLMCTEVTHYEQLGAKLHYNPKWK